MMATDDPTPVAIRRLRDRLNLSQAQFARMLGCDVGTVSRWEGGQRRPTLEYAAKLRQLVAEQAAIELMPAETEAAMAWAGETHILRAMEQAQVAGVSPLALVLLPDAIRAHDAGERQVDWIMQKQHLGGDRLSVEVARLDELGLWPWSTPAADGRDTSGSMG